ncbi:MAG TPA: hypothetical protein VK489_15145 [Ferruginibacter sp.]|nr:hypothetical protein [Ferruginibacter sp.]
MRTITQCTKFILCSAILSFVVITTNAQAEEAKNLPNFLLPEFSSGIIKFKSGETKTAIINYNTVDQEVVFQQKDGYMVLDDPGQIDTIFVANKTLVPFNKVFYELVVTGPLTLFIQHKSNAEHQGTPTVFGAKTYATNNTYPRQVYGPTGTINLRVPDDFKIVNATEYWVRKNGEMDKFTTKRQFLKIFKEREKELSKFIDSNSISFKNISDLVKLFNYCNEIYS